MKNYKLDIGEMTRDFNNTINIGEVDRFINCHNARLTQEQMSEMVQKHAKKLGYGKRNNTLGNCPYCYLSKSGSIGGYFNISNFNEYEAKKIGLEFFSIKPEKWVNVRMPEEDAMAFFQHREACTSITTPKENIMKWELLK